MACKWYDICPMKRFYEQGKLDKKWVLNYCKSEKNWLNCKRYQFEAKGRFHPDSMLPNGKIDKGLR